MLYVRGDNKSPVQKIAVHTFKTKILLHFIMKRILCHNNTILLHFLVCFTLKDYIQKCCRLQMSATIFCVLDNTTLSFFAGLSTNLYASAACSIIPSWVFARHQTHESAPLISPYNNTDLVYDFFSWSTIYNLHWRIKLLKIFSI